MSQTIALNGHIKSVCSVAWSPLLLGQKIASGSNDHLVKIWDVESSMCLSTLNGHTNCVSSVAWSPLLLGHKIASGSYDYTVIIWDS